MNRFNDLFQKADASFNINYQVVLTQLQELSKDEIEKLTPSTTDKKVYQELISIIEDASKKNISQAELVSKVEKLGTTAKKIITKIPSLINLF